MKPGDKVKCIQKDALLEVGKEYTLTDVPNGYGDPSDRKVVAVDQGNFGVYTYYESYFEPLITDKLEIIKKLCALANSYIGEIVVGSGGRKWKVDSYEVYLLKENAAKSSGSVYGHFNMHGYCVAVKGGGRSIPVEEVELQPTSETIKLTDDYEAVITKDHIVVGCQTISREKLQELLKIQDGFQ